MWACLYDVLRFIYVSFFSFDFIISEQPFAGVLDGYSIQNTNVGPFKHDDLSPY